MVNHRQELRQRLADRLFARDSQQTIMSHIIRKTGAHQLVVLLPRHSMHIQEASAGLYHSKELRLVSSRAKGWTRVQY